ncbi:hypothetical protein GC345_18210 [Yersinia pestis]|nr:hypothetical protein [Yersinia pestis]MBE7762993.1 hypothetical protein [Yersinia pestis]MBE7771303.1 hypothetical protein [Yersinia pestis]MBE7779463.1 hypothetical protein [Yersinia pestis]MBE7783459.1 hypothetical protein [Yersinia pestis]
MRWKPDRAETVYRLRLRQRQFPLGKSPTVISPGKKSRQDSDISQYATGMATIAYGSAGINTGTEITPTRCNKPVFIP